MKNARVLGNYVQKLATEQNVTVPELSVLMNCSEQQVKAFFKGRFFASFRQLQILARKFDVKVSELIQGDESYYNKTVVDCMEDFQNPQAREDILDIIDDLMDIQNALIWLNISGHSIFVSTFPYLYGMIDSVEGLCTISMILTRM